MAIPLILAVRHKRTPISLPKVALVGMTNWLETEGELLRRAGIDYEILDLPTKSKRALWFLKGRFRSFSSILHVGGVQRSWAILAFILRKPIIWHWIGSDIIAFRKLHDGPRTWKSILSQRSAQKWSQAHLSDSPELAKELKSLGIDSHVVRLLPRQIEAEIEPLPSRFSVLSYWDDSHRNFYGGDIVLHLARELRNVEFNILAATGAGEQSLPNVNYLSFVPDICEVYSQSTVLIRIPEHDSLSAMVLEMLARGRYVIYNKRLEGCDFATTFEQAQRALLDIQQRNIPNHLGAEYVRRNFSLDAEAAKLAGVCHLFV